MRAAALAALVLVLAGCASGAAQTSGSLGGDAAALVPPDAVAFVNVDTSFDSKQWKVVADLLGPDVHLDRIKAAVGDGLSLAVLGIDKGKPEAVAFAKPQDEAKLRDFAAKFDRGDEHYTVERVGDWAVIADSPDAFAAVRQASSGRSLADDADFQAATAALKGDALATAFADRAAVKQLPGRLGALARVAGSAKWYAARVAAEDNALRLDVQAQSLQPTPATYRPQLLRDVPSGAVLAVSFKDLDRPLGRVAADPALRVSLRPVERYLGVPITRLAPALRGEGVFYVLPGALLPIFALEVESPTPQDALAALRTIASRLRAKTGNVLPLRVAQYGSRVVLTDGPKTLGTSGGSLLDDQTFKDALAAADVPGEVTWLAYADIQRLQPILQAIAALTAGGRAQTKAPPALDKLGTLVAFGARSGTTSRIELRLTIR